MFDALQQFIQQWFIPDLNQPLEEQWFERTRNIFILFFLICIAICGPKTNGVILGGVFVLSVMYIIKYYHGLYQKNDTMIEPYCNDKRGNRKTKLQHCESMKPKEIQGITQLPINDWTKIPKPNQLRIQTPSRYRFCQDARYTGQDQSYYSTNQALVGKANPKTLAPVPVIPPSMAWDYWGENHVVPSGINDKTHFDMIGSGYASTSTPPVLHPKSFGCPTSDRVYDQRLNNGQYATPEYNITYTSLKPNSEQHKEGCGIGKDVIEGFSSIYPRAHVEATPKNINNVWVNEQGTKGDLIGSTYDPKQMLQHNIPSNIPTGTCNRKPEFDQYNKNMYTTIIEPGVYSRSEVVNPINSNLGISFQQQLHPTTCERNGDSITYVRNDPRIIPPLDYTPALPTTPTPANVYDPRSQGYGTSYRVYIDEMTGQPRYMYDDINAVRAPNFITRNNIDHMEWGGKYGTIDQQNIDNGYTNNRIATNQKYLADTLQARQEMQENYTKRVNDKVLQRRQAPIHTRGMAGPAIR